MAIGFSFSCGTCGSKRCRCDGGGLSVGVAPRTLSSGFRTSDVMPLPTGAPHRKMQLAPPNPFRFEVLRSKTKGGYTLAEVLYPDCSNYEGRKILLLRAGPKSLEALDILDPHFLECGENGLIARFVPTPEGWKLGLQALNSLV